MAPNAPRRRPAIVAPAALAAALLLAGAGEVRAGLAPHWEESGMASWYGNQFAGHRTTSGTTFDPTELTAAHDTLPLGTRIRVTRQDTGDTVVVTITDRMPPKRVRVIDLSRAAAKQLRLLGAGVGPVTLTEAKSGEPEEVAEAPDEVSPRRDGPRRRHLAHRTASAHRSYYPARSGARARH